MEYFLPIRSIRFNSVSVQDMAQKNSPKNTPSQKEFSSLVFDQLSQLDKNIKTADQLSQQALLGDKSVDLHNVTMAMQKASLSLSLTKAMVEKMVSAYNNIVSLR